MWSHCILHPRKHDIHHSSLCELSVMLQWPLSRDTKSDQPSDMHLVDWLACLLLQLFGQKQAGRDATIRVVGINPHNKLVRANTDFVHMLLK